MRGLSVLLGAWLTLTFTMAMPVAAQDATPAAAPATAAVAPGGARTDRRTFLPFTRDGLNPRLTAKAHERGTCPFTSSAALARPDAWDCIGESNEIYDPCFENPFATRDNPGELACIASPFTTDVVLFTLTAPLERSKEATTVPGTGPNTAADLTDPWVLPWALELGNGDRCTLLPGTRDVFAGQPVDYGCTGGGGILGRPDQTQPVWTVSYLAEGDIATKLVDVVVAWS